MVEWPDSVDARTELLRVKGATVYRVRGADKLYVSSVKPAEHRAIERAAQLRDRAERLQAKCAHQKWTAHDVGQALWSASGGKAERQ